MDSFTSIITILCFIPVLLGIRKWLKWKRMLNILEPVPGPVHLPLIGSTLQFLIKREDILPTAANLCKEFGPICYFWTVVSNLCLVSKAEYVEKILNNSREINKSHFYTFLEPWIGTGLLTGKGAKWFSHRKLLTPSFHFSILESFIVTFNEKSKILENKLRRMKPGIEFDMYPYITLCSLDIICETVMGVNMHTQSENQDKQKSDYISGIYQISEATLNRLFRPWLHPGWVFFYLSSEGKKYTESLKFLHGFSNKVVADKRASRKVEIEEKIRNIGVDLGVKKKQAFLDLMLEASDKEQMLTDEEIREEVDTFMFEGHDTTTAAICWSVFLLGHHQQIQEKVFEELECIFQGEPRNITSADLKEMKYLERVIKETLRLYPSVPFFERTLMNDMQLGEYLIPAGVEILIAVYNMHRSAEYFENPEIFNSDNFLPEKIRNRHPFAYVPFSAGSRNCIGQKFAIMELKAILATIFLNFKVESVEKIEDITLLADLILRPKSGLKVKLHPRLRKSVNFV